MEATRARIVEAACRLLASGGFGVFTIDTVARAADVSRMTVYNQFGSRSGLLEAIFDWVAERGQVRRLGEAADLPQFVRACCALWTSNRTVHRRLVGLAAIDPDFGAALAGRERRRAESARALLAGCTEAAVRRVLALTGFASVDALAGADDPLAAADLVQALVERALAWEPN